MKLKPVKRDVVSVSGFCVAKTTGLVAQPERLRQEVIEDKNECKVLYLCGVASRACICTST
jgi:hypothetical protein